MLQHVCSYISRIHTYLRDKSLSISFLNPLCVFISCFLYNIFSSDTKPFQIIVNFPSINQLTESGERKCVFLVLRMQLTRPFLSSCEGQCRWKLNRMSQGRLNTNIAFQINCTTQWGEARVFSTVKAFIKGTEWTVDRLSHPPTCPPPRGLPSIRS